MLNIAICDDSREDRKRLRKFLEETGFLVSIQEFESGEALLRLEETFPVIFLDIDMKGISGIETARPPVVVSGFPNITPTFSRS